MPAKLLFIDDDTAVCDAISATLTARGFQVVCANAGASALQALADNEFDVVITDLNMPGMSGLELCRRTHASWPELPVILVTAFGSLQSAVGALRAGAYDFISKPIQFPELLVTLEGALEHRRLKRESVARPHVNAPQRLANIDDAIGVSPAMQVVDAMVTKLSKTDVTVLITGESGTGKELIAKSIHQRSPRREGPLVAINCAAIQPTLLESELFGHVRGAFTDARTQRRGLFLEADGGTLFLDEIGDMPLETQVKVLRALQERVVRPVGGERELPFDVRVVSATSRNLEHDVAEKRFREDLYYRINVIHIQVPPLRARGHDIQLIAEHYIKLSAQQFKRNVSGLEPEAAARLLAYPWPGNVRELKNCMERAVALTQGPAISLQDLPERVRTLASASIILPPDAEQPEPLLSMEEVERRYVMQVLKAVDGSRSEAARTLGFDRRTLYRKLKGYGLS
jgi:two-component system response regulator HydG